MIYLRFETYVHLPGSLNENDLIKRTQRTPEPYFISILIKGIEK